MTKHNKKPPLTPSPPAPPYTLFFSFFSLVKRTLEMHCPRALSSAFSCVLTTALFTSCPELILFLFQMYCLSHIQEEGFARSMSSQGWRAGGGGGWRERGAPHWGMCEGACRWQKSISLQISGEPVTSVLHQGSRRVPITIDLSIKLCSTFPNMSLDRNARELSRIKNFILFSQFCSWRFIIVISLGP